MCSPWEAPEQRWALLQVHIDELNIAEVQAEYEGPGGRTGLLVWCRAVQVRRALQTQMGVFLLYVQLGRHMRVAFFG